MNDDTQLVRLMGKTGVVIELLDVSNAKKFLAKALNSIKEREYIDFFLAWIIAAVDRDVELSIDVQNSILEIFKELLEVSFMDYFRLDELQVSEINRVYNLLHSCLC